MYSVDRANTYINENKNHINSKFRLEYHVMPEIGWINDPNGLIHYKGQFHVFYQYNPYGTAPGGDMHWGHSVSDDLVRFRSMGVALAPDLSDETGIWSGGAEINRETNELVLMYTKHYEKEVKKQTQNLAFSTDGIHFQKKDGAIIDTDMLPEHADKEEFRDPNSVYIDGQYYIIVGSKDKENHGQFLVYKSKDLESFSYHGTIGANPYFGTMAECPDLFKIDDKDVLLFSVVGLQKEKDRFRNENSSLYMIGNIDVVNNIYDIEFVGEIDRGHDFYAPQSLTDENGRRIMLAWMEMWGKDYYLDINNHGWNGAMTFPRELSLEGNRLCQYPVCEILNYRGEKKLLLSEKSVSKVLDIEMTVDDTFKYIRFNDTNQTEYFEIGLYEGKIYLDTSKTHNHPQERRTTLDTYDKVDLRILLDKSSVEVFVGNGVETFTSRIFMDSEEYVISIKGEVIRGEIYELDV